MTDRLPDKLESNGRVEVRVDGTVVGTRRIIDFVSSGGNADDGGLADKVSVDMSVFGGGGGSVGPGIQLFGHPLGVSWTAPNDFKYLVFDQAYAPDDPTFTDLGALPGGLGLSYPLDLSTTVLTATTDGIWAVTASCDFRDGFTNGDIIKMSAACDGAGGFARCSAPYQLIGGVSAFNSELSVTTVMHLSNGQTMWAIAEGYIAANETFDPYFNMTITRLA